MVKSGCKNAKLFLTEPNCETHRLKGQGSTPDAPLRILLNVTKTLDSICIKYYIYT